MATQENRNKTATQKKPHLLKSGAPAHVFTDEDRRRGLETRRERAKSFRERLAQKLDKRADEIADKLLAAGEDDWRAFVAAIEQAFGKPAQALTGEGGGPIEVRHQLIVEAVQKLTAETSTPLELDPGGT